MESKYPSGFAAKLGARDGGWDQRQEEGLKCPRLLQEMPANFSWCGCNLEGSFRNAPASESSYWGAGAGRSALDQSGTATIAPTPPPAARQLPILTTALAPLVRPSGART